MLSNIYSTYSRAEEKLDSLIAIDYFFAKQVSQYILPKVKLDDESQIELFHLLMLLQHYYRSGNSCMPMKIVAENTFWQTQITDDTDDIKLGYTFSNISNLEKIVTTCANIDKQAISYHFDCMYINRLWLYENEIAANIHAKSQLITDTLNIENVKDTLSRLFKDENTDIDWQKLAVTNSLGRNFSVISGGPGTGKTTTVAKLILALQMLSDKSLNIQMIAPTGKAAQRLKESITNSKSLLSELDTSCLPDDAKTIHRFLGIKRNSTYIKYNKKNQSPCDVLIIDEASMIDISMFVNIIRAIKDDCKVVLLGDVNQLPSVETGNILSELAQVCDKNSFTPKALSFIKETCKYNLQQSTQNYDFITFLEKSYRTNSQEILKLASDVIAGVTGISQSDSVVYKNITNNKKSKSNKDIDDFISYVCKNYFSKITTANTAGEALTLLKKFRILIANKNIEIGTEILNQKIERKLGKTPNTNYNGRAIMVVENSYSTGLFNGDVGVIWNDKAYFEDTNSQLKEIGISRLPKTETVFAMTIHKTQGSEFDTVAIMLPDDHNRLLTRELLYTGITRAKSKVYIVSNKQVWDTTVKKSITRFSNVGQILQQHC